ncbi:MAG TPA: glycosyltransferase family 2 protein [Thermoanaerobaculia bacterium]|nr:glycosyltransferase family 2 protein [Thermoanaerobaculia bacterium]
MTESGSPSPTSAVVVHYGPWTSTTRTLRSLSRAAPGVPVLLVDNSASAAPWGDREAPAGVRLLQPGRNVGYGAACNLAARESAARFLLFLNNDVELEPGSLEAMVSTLEEEKGVAAVGPRLYDSRRRPVRSIFRAPSPRRVLFESLFLPRLLPGIPFFHGHHTALTSHTRARDVETLSGAVVLVRRDAFEQVGGFDEAFFFYAEESDLFARLHRSGWRVRYQPSARAVHHGGVASAEVTREELDRRLNEALRLYARRHHGPRGERQTTRALLWGARLRWALAHLAPGERGRRRRRRYAAILRASSSR